MSHTATGEWQSFEGRMRRRRAERLARRAEAAALAGCFEDARTCLEEARALAPGLPALALAERALSPDRVREIEPPAALPAEALETRGEDIPAVHSSGHDWRWVASAAVLLLLAGAGGYVFTRGTEALPADRIAAPVPSPPVDSPRRAAPTFTRQSRPPLAVPPVVSVDESAFVPATIAQPAPASSLTLTQPAPAAEPAATSELPVTQVVPREEPATPQAVPVNPVLDLTPAVPVAPPAVAPVAPAPDPPQEPIVRGVLTRYAAAYSELDVDAAQRVWPGVDRSALAHAFEGLALQRVSLGDCRIVISGSAAEARCAGTTTWAPKVGGGSRTEARDWTFQLERDGARWQIVSARVQNR